MSMAKVIRSAALKAPPAEPWIAATWVHPHGDATSFVYSRLQRLDEWWDRRVTLDERRMFLLFVAEDCECIERANAAAYHGDIDGDFDY